MVRLGAVPVRLKTVVAKVEKIPLAVIVFIPTVWLSATKIAENVPFIQEITEVIPK